ncbi:MAG: hypothetical protein JNM39_18510 [Bdellovibrionaceae bacterium]|nr:hypothetical protein [Pseudobdellovibrionaceae bacterium]
MRITPPKYEYYLASGPALKSIDECSQRNRTEAKGECLDKAKKKAISIDSLFECHVFFNECMEEIEEKEGLRKGCEEKGASCLKMKGTQGEKNLADSLRLFLAETTYAKIACYCRQVDIGRLRKLPCFKACLDNFTISPAELSHALAGKKVFGLVDACHSGGFIEAISLPDKMLVASSLSDEISNDTLKGGRLIRHFNQVINDINCRSVPIGNHDSHTTVNRFFGRTVELDLEGGRVQTSFSSIKGNRFDGSRCAR